MTNIHNTQEEFIQVKREPNIKVEIDYTYMTVRRDPNTIRERSVPVAVTSKKTEENLDDILDFCNNFAINNITITNYTSYDLI